jgi:hypothetical protein
VGTLEAIALTTLAASTAMLKLAAAKTKDDNFMVEKRKV